MCEVEVEVIGVGGEEVKEGWVEEVMHVGVLELKAAASSLGSEVQEPVKRAGVKPIVAAVRCYEHVSSVDV